MTQQEIFQTVTKAVNLALKNSGKEWVSKREACDLLNCSVSTLDKLIMNGQVTASGVGIKGKTVSVSRKSINNYHESQIFKPYK